MGVGVVNCKCLLKCVMILSGRFSQQCMPVHWTVGRVSCLPICSPTTSSGVVVGVCLGGGRYRGSTRGVGLKVSVPVLLYS